jgi:hypothetical protein
MPPNATGEPDKDVGETIAHDHDQDDAEIVVPISEAVVVLSKDAVTAGLEEFFRDQLSQRGVEVVHRVRERLSRGRSVQLAQLVSAETHCAAIEQAQEALRANESKEEDDDVAANALEGKEGERESKHDEDRNDDTFDDGVDHQESEQKAALVEEKTSDGHNESTKAKSDGRSSTGDIRTNAAKLVEEVSLVLLSQPQFADKVKRLAKAHVCRGDEHALALVCRGPGARHAIARVLNGEVLRAKVDELGLQMFDVDPVQVAAKAAEEAAAAIAEQEGDNAARKGQAGKDKRNKAAPEGDAENNPDDKLIPQSPLLFLSSSLPRFDQGLRNFFCTAPAPLGDDAEAFGDSSSRVVSRKNVMVHLDQLIQFMFPTNLQHPRSTGRLLLFGEFGPLDEDSNLRCGAQGMHVVRRYELNALGKQIEEEDLLDIFAPGEVLAADQKAEVLREVTKTLCNTSQITKREVHKVRVVVVVVVAIAGSREFSSLSTITPLPRAIAGHRLEPGRVPFSTTLRCLELTGHSHVSFRTHKQTCTTSFIHSP